MRPDKRDCPVRKAIQTTEKSYMCIQVSANKVILLCSSLVLAIKNLTLAIRQDESMKHFRLKFLLFLDSISHLHSFSLVFMNGL